MKNETPSLEAATISEILARDPAAAQVFMGLHTHCVGCLLARFCTPIEVASWYRIELSTLLGDLERSALIAGPKGSIA
jgi:uncharacterized protein (UPF0179 family)